MIKLIVNPTGQAITYSFNKRIVFIGRISSGDQHPDLALDSQDLEVHHLKIVELDDRFQIINLANDPFTTLNGLPFGKKFIKNNDKITIGQTTICFEGQLSEKESQPEPESAASPEPAQVPVPEKPIISTLDDEEKLLNIIEHAITSHRNASANTQTTLSPPPRETLHWTEEEFDLDAELWKLEQSLEASANSDVDEDQQAADIDQLLKRVEELEKAFMESNKDDDQEEQINLKTKADIHPLQPDALARPHEDVVKITDKRLAPENTPGSPGAAVAPEKPPVQRQSLKDYYLSEFDDESENWQPSKEKKNPSPTILSYLNWKTISALFLLLLVIIAIIFGSIYISFSGKSEEEEMRAAEGVADVAMALTYAQITHAVPQNQNWSDPDFLKNNLTAVLASEYMPLANLDSHGQFNNSPYILRIYTSSDLSQFLVIAQPNPSLLQWLIPKTTILMDSHAMELRKTTDVKTLNRLLVNPTIDSSNTTEISTLVKQGSLIPLKLLSSKQVNQGFAPPKALAFLRPGAENRIYNSPRYYHFGESLMRKAISLYENEANSHEISVLKDEMQAFAKFQNIVLYSSGGIQSAVLAQKALATFLPQYKFLFAYLQFDSKGIVNSSHLLIDDQQNSEVVALNMPKPIEEQPVQKLEAISATTSDAALAEPAPAKRDTAPTPEKPDKNNELDDVLVLLHEERQKALKPISAEIAALLKTENQKAIHNFQAKLQALQKKYDTTSAKFQEKIIRAISFLYMASVFEDSPQEIISDSPPEQSTSVKGDVVESEEELDTPETAAPTSDTESKVDKNHPLFFRLTALYNARQQTLKPISDQMIAYLDGQNSKSSKNNPEKLAELEKRYEKTAEELQGKLAKAVSDLSKEYAYMPMQDFMSYVKATGLDSIIQENVRQKVGGSEGLAGTSGKIQGQIKKIQESEDLNALDENTAETAKLLTLEKLPDPSKLVSYQSAIHAIVTKKLEQLLFSPNSTLTLEDYSQKNKVVLARILKTAWVTDPDEVDYYLNEFDVHSQQR